MKIFLTGGAEKNYRSIRCYLTEKWSEAVATAFENKVKDFLIVLNNFPEIGHIEVAEKQIRSFPITKQIVVFYRISIKDLLGEVEVKVSRRWTPIFSQIFADFFLDRVRTGRDLSLHWHGEFFKPIGY